MFEEPIYLKDGDVIQPELGEDLKYTMLDDQTWYLEAETGYWGLVFSHMDIEKSDNCTYDVLLIKENRYEDKHLGK